MKYHSELTKLSTLPNGELDPQGAAAGGPIFEGYTVKGFHFEMPITGQPFEIHRYERNGEAIMGTMTTSPVTFVTELGDIVQFQTRNSIYRLKKILDENNQVSYHKFFN